MKELAEQLAAHPAVREKLEIARAYQPAGKVAGGIPLGDDCAAIPDPATGGYLLFAAEGMLASFIADDPWFAGYSAVMVNLSDVAAMGGIPIAITDVLTIPDHDAADAIWEGMRSASEAYGVPIVGGHTTLTGENGATGLAASVFGRAGNKLLTSFDAKPGDALMIAVDMRGSYRKDKPFWNASTTTSPEELQRNLELLSELAESGLCKAAKDISNGGIIGTLAMLCECSGVGAEIDLPSLPRPEDTPLLKWLTSFPSYGYLLSVPKDNIAAVTNHFTPAGITCTRIGTILSRRVGSSLRITGEENSICVT